MRKTINKLLVFFFAILLALSACGKATDSNLDKVPSKKLDISKGETRSRQDKKKEGQTNKKDKDTRTSTSQPKASIEEDKSYYSKDDLVEYLKTYNKLPKNYLTKREARDLGWVASKGNLWDVTDRGVIGGDRFGNREGKLPNKKGRKYFEADVNYKGGRRKAERLIYSNDGLIFYTDDHYKTFEKQEAAR